MRLIDCFSGGIGYVAACLARAGETPLNFQEFKKDLDLLWERSEKLAQKGGFSEKDYDQARFAVCAWIDEAILCSNWPEKGQWGNRQLQRFYYNTTNAGEEFFERLYLLTTEEREVLEVYCACLVMGFKGRHFTVREIPALESVNHNVVEKVAESISNPFATEEARFFPDSYLEESERAKRKREWGIVPLFLAALTIGVGAAASVFFFMDNYLNRMVELYFKSGM